MKHSIHLFSGCTRTISNSKLQPIFLRLDSIPPLPLLQDAAFFAPEAGEKAVKLFSANTTKNLKIKAQ